MLAPVANPSAIKKEVVFFKFPITKKHPFFSPPDKNVL